VGLFTAVILLVACGLLATAFLRGFSGNRCLVADRVWVVDELREDGQTLYLAYRISGWHEKVEYYELYATLPSFDVCGDTKEEQLDMDNIDDTEGKMVKDVLVRNTKHGQKLEIRYTRQADEGVEPNQAKLIRGDTIESNPEDNPRVWGDE